MTTQTEKMLSTSWNLVRDAGSAVADAAVNSSVATSLVKSLPKASKQVSRLKEMVSVGAGLAIAKRGARVAVAVVKRNPVAAIAGAVALAGLGVAVTVARKRKLARENGETATPRTSRRLAAKDMRSNGASKTVAAKKAARAPRTRKPKTTVSTH